MDHKNFYSLLPGFILLRRQAMLSKNYLCITPVVSEGENAETNGHFFLLFSHVFTRHPVAFPSGAALCGGDPPYVPAETSDPKPCHRHRFFVCFHRLLFQSLSDFPFGPYQVWPFAQVLAESALTGGFPNGISSGSIIGTPALSQAWRVTRRLNCQNGKAAWPQTTCCT